MPDSSRPAQLGLRPTAARISNSPRKNSESRTSGKGQGQQCPQSCPGCSRHSARAEGGTCGRSAPAEGREELDPHRPGGYLPCGQKKHPITSRLQRIPSQHRCPQAGGGEVRIQLLWHGGAACRSRHLSQRLPPGAHRPGGLSGEEKPRISSTGHGSTLFILITRSRRFSNVTFEASD